MNIMPKYLPMLASPSRWWITVGRRMVSVACVLADALVILTVSCVTGAIYHQLLYDTPGSLVDFAEVGLAAAAIFVLPGIVHGEYELSHYLSFKAHVRRATTLWNITLLCLLMLGFLIKTTGDLFVPTVFQISQTCFELHGVLSAEKYVRARRLF